MSKEKNIDAAMEDETPVEESKAKKSKRAAFKTTRQLLDEEERVPVFIPRMDGDERNFMTVSINDVNYQIKLDEWVDVPKSVATVIGDVRAAEARGRRQLADDVKRMRELAAMSGGGVY